MAKNTCAYWLRQPVSQFSLKSLVSITSRFLNFARRILFVCIIEMSIIDHFSDVTQVQVLQKEKQKVVTKLEEKDNLYLSEYINDWIHIIYYCSQKIEWNLSANSRIEAVLNKLNNFGCQSFSRAININCWKTLVRNFPENLY